MADKIQTQTLNFTMINGGRYRFALDVPRPCTVTAVTVTSSGWLKTIYLETDNLQESLVGNNKTSPTSFTYTNEVFIDKATRFNIIISDYHSFTKECDFEVIVFYKKQHGPSRDLHTKPVVSYVNQFPTDILLVLPVPIIVKCVELRNTKGISSARLESSGIPISSLTLQSDGYWRAYPYCKLDGRNGLRELYLRVEGDNSIKPSQLIHDTFYSYEPDIPTPTITKIETPAVNNNHTENMSGTPAETVIPPAHEVWAATQMHQHIKIMNTSVTETVGKIHATQQQGLSEITVFLPVCDITEQEIKNYLIPKFTNKGYNVTRVGILVHNGNNVWSYTLSWKDASLLGTLLPKSS